MSDIDMACACDKLKHLLKNPSAVQRYTTIRDAKYVHPGWVDYQKKHTVRRYIK